MLVLAVLCVLVPKHVSLLFIISIPVDKTVCFSGEHTELTVYSAISYSNTEEYKDGTIEI